MPLKFFEMQCFCWCVISLHTAESKKKKKIDRYKLIDTKTYSATTTNCSFCLQLNYLIFLNFFSFIRNLEHQFYKIKKIQI